MADTCSTGVLGAGAKSCSGGSSSELRAYTTPSEALLTMSSEV